MMGMLGTAAVGAAVGIAASAWVHVLARKRDNAIWEAVNQDRVRINRIQTAIKWRKYGGFIDLRDELAKEMADEIVKKEKRERA